MMLVSLARPSHKERGSIQTAVVELYQRNFHTSTYFGCEQLSELTHVRMHVAVERMNASGPSCLLCSRTCTMYRERKRLHVDSCAEARRVPRFFGGPEGFFIMKQIIYLHQ